MTRQTNVIAIASLPVIAIASLPVIASAFREVRSSHPATGGAIPPRLLRRWKALLAMTGIVIASASTPVIASAFCEVRSSHPATGGAISPAISSATPDEPDSLIIAARASYYDGAYDRVIAILQSSASPRRTPEEDYYLGSAFAALNDPRNALRYLRAAVDSAPAVTSYRYQLAKAFAAAGTPVEARVEYRRILAVDSTFLPALFNLGTISFDARDYRTASDLFTRTVGLNPRDYLAYYDLGASLVNLGLGDSAAQFLHASVTLNSRFIPSLTLLASLYYKKKMYDDAARLYAMVAARDSMIAENWARWGNCMEKLQNWRWMAHCFRTAASLDTANASYCARLGQAWYEGKEYDSAAAAYLRAGVLDPENPVPFLNAGLAYASMDSARPAISAFRRAYASCRIERIGFIYAQIAGVQYKQKWYRHAEESYMKSLRYDPGNARALFFLAHAREELRKLGPAAEAYRQFLRKAAGDRSMRDLVKYARKRLRELPAGR